MNKVHALRELRANINCNFCHAVLLYDGRSWHTELHTLELVLLTERRMEK